MATVGERPAAIGAIGAGFKGCLLQGESGVAGRDPSRMTAFDRVDHQSGEEHLGGDEHGDERGAHQIRGPHPSNVGRWAADAGSSCEGSVVRPPPGSVFLGRMIMLGVCLQFVSCPRYDPARALFRRAGSKHQAPLARTQDVSAVLAEAPRIDPVAAGPADAQLVAMTLGGNSEAFCHARGAVRPGGLSPGLPHAPRRRRSAGRRSGGVLQGLPEPADL